MSVFSTLHLLDLINEVEDTEGRIVSPWEKNLSKPDCKSTWPQTSPFFLETQFKK